MPSSAAMGSDDCLPENLAAAFKALPQSASSPCWRANPVHKAHAYYLAFPSPNTYFSVLA